ncbi:hypothetical protein [Ekhidna sp.]|jgi:hypothetical protein|uniref:hypothetical protein n=1 Tax=Ekhidna sp. TaxID=2608089 RepID=UPI0032F048F0
MANKYNLPDGALITREISFQDMSDKEQEMIVKGMKDHLSEIPEIGESTHNEVRELMIIDNPLIVEYLHNGNQLFKMRSNIKKGGLMKQIHKGAE